MVLYSASLLLTCCWLERCVRPSCCTVLSALQASSSVMCTRCRVLGWLRSACAGVYDTLTHTSAGMGVGVGVYGTHTHTHTHTSTTRTNTRVFTAARLQGDARGRGVGDDGDQLVACLEGRLLMQVDLEVGLGWGASQPSSPGTQHTTS